MINPANTIEEVISILQAIITEETRLNSPLAYFPALYRMVTIRVKKGIDEAEFIDGDRMQRLDVLFANRFIEAYISWKKGLPVTSSWRITFESGNRGLIILHHLLLGMNAHINLDLGIVSAEVMKGKPLAGLQSDFNTINRMLAEMTDIVQSRLGKVSPLLGLLDRFAGNSDAMIIKFSITEARDGAWKSAGNFHSSSNPENLIKGRDRQISSLGLRLIYPASSWVKFLISSIRLAEKKKVKTNVSIITG